MEDPDGISDCRKVTEDASGASITGSSYEVSKIPYSVSVGVKVRKIQMAYQLRALSTQED